MRPASTHLKVRDSDILGRASSWTSPLSPRLPGGIPASSEAAQGELFVLQQVVIVMCHCSGQLVMLKG